MKLFLGHRRQLLVSSLFVIYLACNTTMGQTATPSPHPSPTATPQAAATPTPPPVANPADVSSIDAIINAVYEVHSGDQGKKREADRFRSLFVPGGRLIPTGKSSAGLFNWRVTTIEEYVNRIFPQLEEQGFFEKEVGRRTETWGNIAQVFSAYESRRKADDPKPFMRGINSFQLINDGKRWWIITVLWQNEDEKNPLPEGLLKKPN